MLKSWMLHPMVPNGIVTHLYAGTAEETANLNGKVGFCTLSLEQLFLTISIAQYLIPWARVGNPRADTQNAETGKALWEWLEGQIAER